MTVSKLLKQAILEAVKAQEGTEASRRACDRAVTEQKQAEEKVRAAYARVLDQARKDFPNGPAELLILLGETAYLVKVSGHPNSEVVKVYDTLSEPTPQ